MDKVVSTKSPITRHSTRHSNGLDPIDLGLLEALLSGQSVMNHALQSGQPRSKLYVRMGRPAFQEAMREALEARRAEVLGQYANLIWLGLETLGRIIRNDNGRHSVQHQLRAIELILRLKDNHNDREQTL